MNKYKILDYLEDNLKSHPNDIMDNNNRLVWITDCSQVVYRLMKSYIHKDVVMKLLERHKAYIEFYDELIYKFNNLEDK